MTPTQQERSRKWRATPAGKYSEHKRFARQRGVEFKLTFDEWWAIWKESGHFAKRGNRHGCYVMCRRGDEGAYAVGNVFIGKFERNFADGRAAKRWPDVKRKHTRKTTTVRFADEVGSKVKSTYGAAEAPF